MFRSSALHTIAHCVQCLCYLYVLISTVFFQLLFILSVIRLQQHSPWLAAIASVNFRLTRLFNAAASLLRSAISEKKKFAASLHCFFR